MLYSSQMSWDYLLFYMWVTGLNPELITSYDAARAAWIFCSITKIKTHNYVGNSWSSEINHKDQWAWYVWYTAFQKLFWWASLKMMLFLASVTLNLNTTLNSTTVSCNSYSTKWKPRKIRVQQKMKMFKAELVFTIHTVKGINYTELSV
jgi:hypothetical protein